MSAQGQERKEAGASTPIIPQKSDGGFRGLLKRLFAESALAQLTPITPKIVQPPPGLEDFAAKIQQGVDGYLSEQRQQELERLSAEAARIAAEVEKQAIGIQRQKELESKRATDVVEAKETLARLHVEEKLQYINNTAWEKMGKVGQFAGIGNIWHGNSEWDNLGGFELVYYYPDYTIEEQKRGYYHRSRYIRKKTPAWLQVYVLQRTQSHYQDFDYTHMIDEVSRQIMVSSSFPEQSIYEKFNVVIPCKNIDTEMLLDEALLRETIMRTPNSLPKQLELKGNLKLSGLDWGWGKWYSSGDPNFAGH